MEDGRNIIVHMNVFNGYLDQLQTVGVKIDEEDKRLLLLMEDGWNIIMHMNVFNGFLDHLQKVRVKINEDDKAILLLTSLFNSYDTLVTTLLYGKDIVGIDQVQAILVTWESQKKTKVEDGYDYALVNEKKIGEGVQMEGLREIADPDLIPKEWRYDVLDVKNLVT